MRNSPSVPNLAARASIKYKTCILNPDGSVASERPWKRNLILDGGLDMIGGGTGWGDVFTYGVVGTGSDPTKRDSGTITFTRTGSTVAASAGFFEAADVGRLLKFDTGEEMYITAFTDTQTVTVGVSSPDLPATQGTVWYVNQTALTTESKRTNTYSQSGGDNQTTFSVDTFTMKRTYLFSAETAPVTYTEIGWSNGSAGNLFGRDLVPGVGDSLAAGQQYKVVIQLTIKLTPSAPLAAADVGNNGFSTAGNVMVETVIYGMTTVGANGASSVGPWGKSFEPGGSGVQVQLITADWTQQTAITTSDISVTSVSENPSWAGYSAGSFYRDVSATFDVNTGNGAIYGVCAGSGQKPQVSVHFTAAQAKDSNHTLTVKFRFSWGRELVN